MRKVLSGKVASGIGFKHENGGLATEQNLFFQLYRTIVSTTTERRK